MAQLQAKNQDLRVIFKKLGVNSNTMSQNYNLKRVVRVRELEQWFATNLGSYPCKLTEPKMIEIGKVAEMIETLKDSRFRGQPIIGFDTKKASIGCGNSMNR
uniref:Uncharacterized protein n=1 Tax=Romanomermis culicivorax TaxID=13658 RepID=A0A915IFQ0_ROMCU